MPKELSIDAAEEAGFSGIVLHSSQFRARLDDILELVKHKEEDDGAILVVGGGKSAKECVLGSCMRSQKLSDQTGLIVCRPN